MSRVSYLPLFNVERILGAFANPAMSSTSIGDVGERLKGGVKD